MEAIPHTRGAGHASSLEGQSIDAVIYRIGDLPTPPDAWATSGQQTQTVCYLIISSYGGNIRKVRDYLKQQTQGIEIDLIDKPRDKEGYIGQVAKIIFSSETSLEKFFQEGSKEGIRLGEPPLPPRQLDNIALTNDQLAKYIIHAKEQYFSQTKQQNP